MTALAPRATANPRATTLHGAAAVLADVARTTTAGTELPHLLGRISELVLEATNADRVSCFLFEGPKRRLRVAAAKQRSGDDPELWRQAQALPPIDVVDDELLQTLFGAGEPLPIPDGARSSIVPADWAATFGLGALVLGPLRHGRSTLGLLVVDWRTPRDLAPEVVHLVGAVARSAAMAVQNAMLSDALAVRAAGLQSLLQASRTLLGTRTVSEAAEAVADAIADVLGAEHLSVHVFDGGHDEYRTLTQRGAGLPASGDVRSFPRSALAKVRRAWRDHPRPPVVLDGIDRLASHPALGHLRELGAVIALPLARPDGELFGFVLAGLAERPDEGTLELAEALTAHVAFAVDRVRLDAQVALGVEFAWALLAVNEIDHDTPGGVVAGVRRAIPAAIGFDVTGIWLGDQLGSGAKGKGQPPRPRFVTHLWQHWRSRRTRPEVIESGGDLYAPIWGRDRAVGILRVAMLRGPLAAHERAQLEALAAALGEAMEQHRLRHLVDRHQRELAMAGERAAVAAQLHDQVGRVLATIAIESEQLAAQPKSVIARANRLALLARAGLGELRSTAESLTSLHYDADGLEATLTEVVTSMAGQLDAAADVAVTGTARNLPLEVEQALIRILHETLARLEPGGHAGAIAVRLDFLADTVVLEIRDDGAGLLNRQDPLSGRSPLASLRFMRGRLEQLGGRLDVTEIGPRGLRLRATVPA